MNRYDQLAQRLHLRSDPPTTTIFTQVTTLDGTFDGERIWVQRINGGNSLTTRALLEPALPFRFEVGPEVWTTKLAHVVGIHDVAIGDAEFDAKFRIDTKHVDELKQLLKPVVRALLWELQRSGWRFVVSDRGVDLISLPASPLDDTEEVVEQQLRSTVEVLRKYRAAIA